MGTCAHVANKMNDISDIGDSSEIKKEKTNCSDELNMKLENQLDLFSRKVIEYPSESYTGDGISKMDKKYSIYHKGNQELLIENECVSAVSAKEILKSYIIETRCNRMSIAVSKAECYNTTNMIVATQEEVC